MMVKAKFFVGQIVHHNRFDYRGVVVDVDARFEGSEAWYEQVARKRRLYRELAQRGNPVQGQVTERIRRRLPKARLVHFLRYRFQAADGETFTGMTPVSRQAFNVAEIGQPIDILYLVEDPSVHRPREILARRGYLS